MRTLYIDCGMGAAGDMLSAALSELLKDEVDLADKVNEAGIPGVVVNAEKSVKCGITGTHFSVKIYGEEEETGEHHHHEDEHGHGHHHEHHHHASMEEIHQIVQTLQIPEEVKKDILEVYEEIAKAESEVHGVPVSAIHFHEVGSKDAIADITAVCLGMYYLKADRVLVSPVHVGSGHVHCAHGILPVPAPATARILKDIPVYSTDVKGELCTPTGAALLKHFASSFGNMPVMRVKSIGYGMGKKDFERANCVRMLLGESEEASDVIYSLSCNLDDMTGEEIGFATEELFSHGAREVFTTPIQMKKNRPGVLLTVFCMEEKKEEMLQQIFRNTTTLGVREEKMERHVLRRSLLQKESGVGTVQVKESYGFGTTKKKIEFEDLARIARENQCSLREAREMIEK